MDTAGAFDNYYWVHISHTSFPWLRWVSNIARDQIGHGVSFAWAKKKERDWFEFQFINVTDLARPCPCSPFTVWLWKERGRDLKTRVL